MSSFTNQAIEQATQHYRQDCTNFIENVWNKLSFSQIIASVEDVQETETKPLLSPCDAASYLTTQLKNLPPTLEHYLSNSDKHLFNSNVEFYIFTFISENVHLLQQKYPKSVFPSTMLQHLLLQKLRPLSNYRRIHALMGKVYASFKAVRLDNFSYHWKDIRQEMKLLEEIYRILAAAFTTENSIRQTKLIIEEISRLVQFLEDVQTNPKLKYPGIDDQALKKEIRIYDDIESLQHVLKYLKVASDINLDSEGVKLDRQPWDDKVIGPLVLDRILQVVGEYFKADGTNQRLSRETKTVLVSHAVPIETMTSLRDILSHADNFIVQKKMELASDKEEYLALYRGIHKEVVILERVVENVISNLEMSTLKDKSEKLGGNDAGREENGLVESIIAELPTIDEIKDITKIFRQASELQSDISHHILQYLATKLGRTMIQHLEVKNHSPTRSYVEVDEDHCKQLSAVRRTLQSDVGQTSVAMETFLFPTDSKIRQLYRELRGPSEASGATLRIDLDAIFQLASKDSSHIISATRCQEIQESLGAKRRIHEVKYAILNSEPHLWREHVEYLQENKLIRKNIDERKIQGATRSLEDTYSKFHTAFRASYTFTVKVERIKDFLSNNLKMTQDEIQVVIQILKGREIQALEPYFLNRLKILEGILIEDSENEKQLQKSYMSSAKLQAAVEFLVLDLSDLIKTLSQISDMPKLESLITDMEDISNEDLAKKFRVRNYLGHGDFTLDSLNPDLKFSILKNGLKFLDHGQSILALRQLLGKYAVRKFLEEGGVSNIDRILEDQISLNLEESERDWLKTTTSNVKSSTSWKVFMHRLIERKSLEPDSSGMAITIAEVSLNTRFGQFMPNILSEIGSDAIIHGKIDAWDFCVANGLEIGECRMANGWTWMHLAAQVGNIAIIQRLVLTNADLVNCPDEYKALPLHLAISEDAKIENVQILLKAGGNARQTTSVGNITPMHLACAYNRPDIVELLLEYDPDMDLDTGTKDGLTSLSIAIQNRNLGIVKQLVGRGASINLITRFTTALTEAVRYAADDDEIVQFLLDHHADPNLRFQHLPPPIETAVSNGNVRIVEMLILSGADVTIQFGYNRSLLYSAVAYGHVPVAQFLVQKSNLDINICDQDGRSMLHHATSNNQLEMVKYLISAGATINVEDNNGYRPLAFSCLKGNTEILEFLLEKGAKSDNLQTALENSHINIWKFLFAKFPISANSISSQQLLHNCRNLDILKYLKEEQKVDLKLWRNNRGWTLLQNAVAYNRLELLEYLIFKEGIPIDEVDKNGNTLLHLVFVLKNSFPRLALMNRRYECIEYLLVGAGRQCDLEVQEKCCLQRPLDMALDNEDLRIVLLLLRHGASIHDGMKNPLNLAITHGNFQAVEELIENYPSIDKNAANYDGLSPIQNAAKLNKWRTVKYLSIQEGIDVDACDSEGFTCIHRAAGAGQYELVKFLHQDKGASLENRNDEGETLLHSAAATSVGSDSLQLVQYLVGKGLQIDATTIKKPKVTPLGKASAAGNAPVMQYLIDKGADYTFRHGGTDIITYTLWSKNLEAVKVSTQHMKFQLSTQDYQSGWGILNISTEMTVPVLDYLLQLNQPSKQAEMEILNCDLMFRLLETFAKCSAWDLVAFLIYNKKIIPHGPNFLTLCAKKFQWDIAKYIVQNHNGVFDNLLSIKQNLPILKIFIEHGVLSTIQAAFSNVDCDSMVRFFQEFPKIIEIAAFYGQLEIIEYFEKKAVWNLPVDILLLHSAENNKLNIVRRVFRTSQDQLKKSTIDLALLRAAAKGSSNTVRFLLEKGANVNGIDESSGTSVLQSALLTCQWPVGTILVEAGADVNYGVGKWDVERNPVYSAVRSKNLPFLRTLQKFHAKIDMRLDEMGRNVLHRAIDRDDTELFLTLANAIEIEGASSFEQADRDGNTPLHLASKVSNLAIVKYLIESRKVKTGIRNKNRKTALELAARYSEVGEVINLLMRHTDRSKEDELRLKEALQGNPVIRIQFASKSAEEWYEPSNIQDKLMQAINKQDMELIRECLSEGADVNCRAGRPPLHTLCNYSDGSTVQIVEVLLKEWNANVNLRSENGFTALHMMGTLKNQALVQCLVENGADVNAECCYGLSPIWYATTRSSEGTIKYLLDNKANVNVKNSEGISLIETAAEKGFKCYPLLKKYM